MGLGVSQVKFPQPFTRGWPRFGSGDDLGGSEAGKPPRGVALWDWSLALLARAHLGLADWRCQLALGDRWRWWPVLISGLAVWVSAMFLALCRSWPVRISLRIHHRGGGPVVRPSAQWRLRPHPPSRWPQKQNPHKAGFFWAHFPCQLLPQDRNPGWSFDGESRREEISISCGPLPQL